MRALGRPLVLVALCVTTLLMLEGALLAQTSQPRSTANPYGGLRGNSTRGLATRGASSRGISGRTTARPVAPVIAVEPVEDRVLKPAAPAPTPAAPAPGRRVAPARPAAVQPVAARLRAPLTKVRPRLLTLKGGPVVRADARLDNGEWKYHTTAGWQTLPADAVVRSALESEVLAEVGRRRRSMDREDPVARLDEARWMLDLGLHTEALRELDELLERDDCERGALELLSRADLSQLVSRPETTMDDASAMELLVESATRSTPSVQELVIQELVSYGARHRNELERLLQDQQDSIEPKRRAFGDRALRRLFPARAVER